MTAQLELTPSFQIPKSALPLPLRFLSLLLLNFLPFAARPLPTSRTATITVPDCPGLSRFNFVRPMNHRDSPFWNRQFVKPVSPLLPSFASVRKSVFIRVHPWFRLRHLSAVIGTLSPHPGQLDQSRVISTNLDFIFKGGVTSLGQAHIRLMTIKHH